MGDDQADFGLGVDTCQVRTDEGVREVCHALRVVRFVRAILGSVGVGLVCGLLTYAGVRIAWPSIAVQEFTNVIGLAAVVGAGIGAAIARRRATSESKRTDDARTK